MLQICTLYVYVSVLAAASSVYAMKQEDMYTDNHGLAAAVAGPDFCVLATDTRLAGNSGYDILERHHVQSRIWSAESFGAEEQAAAGPDGSIQISPSAIASSTTGAQSALSLVASYKSRSPLTWVASVGCQSDCEHVKRYLRAQLRKARFFGQSPSSAPTTALALSNLLYTRRTFPYYSSCLVAGFSGQDDGIKMHGQVYAYDVIGSYEAVATACAGNGRSLLQPILDRTFTSCSEKTPPSKQIDGSLLPEEVVERLLSAYRAVSEREISVGDSIVFCCTQRLGDDIFETKIYTAPLKQH